MNATQITTRYNQGTGGGKVVRHGYVTNDAGVSVPKESIVAPPPIATMPHPCDDRRRVMGMSSFQFQTITKIALGGAKADVPMNVALPDARFIMIANIDPGHYSDSLWMHFIPTGKSYAGNVITPTGSEPWLPFCQQTSTLTKVGLFYEFDEPLPPTIYFDIGQEAAGNDYFITFLLARSKAVIPGSMFASVT